MARHGDVRLHYSGAVLGIGVFDGDASAFAALQGEGAAAFEEQLSGLLAQGLARPEWWFVAEQAGTPVGRVAFMTDSPTPDAGSATDPLMEAFLIGLWLRWGTDDLEVGPRLLSAALPSVAALGPPIDARVNAESQSHPDRRRAVLEAAGFGLFQEKLGFVWQDEGSPVPLGDRLIFRSLPEVGESAFAAALSAGCAETLDRNDRYFYDLTGAQRWGEVMMGFLGPDDAPTWRLAYDADGRLVGYVMLSAFDDDVATITHIGVLPEHRRQGYIVDLLARATADALTRGFSSILSDVDTENLPMRAAMERAGHLPGVRPWHVWHYRFPPPD